MQERNKTRAPLTAEKTLAHFKTITRHRMLVAKGCFAVGLYYQGLTHDLSKYAPTEFLVGARYYQGNRSPNNAEREEKGLSDAWLHHKGRNRHHFEYWIDYGNPGCETIIRGVPMPTRFVAEMVADRISASRSKLWLRCRQSIIVVKPTLDE